MFGVLYSLGNKDGKTKDRVEGWRKNIHSLTGDLKKQTKILDNLDPGEQNESGGVDNRRDYFGMLIKRLQDDIDGVMGIARKVMTLNMKKNVSSKD